MRLIDGGLLRKAVTMSAAVEALEAAFRDGPDDPSATARRSLVQTTSGTLLMMPAAGAGGCGVKIVTLTPGNRERGLPFVQAAYLLFDAATQTPEAIIDGTELTALRTGAVSALATRHLAAEDASRLVLFGAGVQARAHAEAMMTVRPIREIRVVSRTSKGSERFVQLAAAPGALPYPVSLGTGSRSDAGWADIVCTCTTAAQPLFDGGLLRAGAHVNAIGAFQPDARELDSATIARASVVVETRAAALAEAGDLIIPMAEGAVGPDHVAADLRELVRGGMEGPRRDVTVFKSVGLAFEDLVVARAAVAAIGG